MKQLEQLQRKPRKYSETSTRFELHDLRDTGVTPTPNKVS